MKDASLIRDILLAGLAAIGIAYIMQIAAAIACMAETQKEFLTFLQEYETVEIQEVEVNP